MALCEMRKLEICDAGVIFMPTFSSQITLKVLCTRVVGSSIFDCVKIHLITTCGRNVQQTDKYT